MSRTNIKKKKATNTVPCIYQTHLYYAVASSALNVFLCKQINLNKMSLRIHRILEACVAVTPIFFYIHQNEVCLFFLISQHFNLYWWTTQALLLLPPKMFCDRHQALNSLLILWLFKTTSRK